MNEKQLATMNSRGELVLSEHAVDIEITVSKPVLVVDPDGRDEQSIWPFRNQLKQFGWKADTASPSVEHKRFHPGNMCRSYYIILLDRLLTNIVICFSYF